MYFKVVVKAVAAILLRSYRKWLCLQLFLFTRRTEVVFGLNEFLPFRHFIDLCARHLV